LERTKNCLFVNYCKLIIGLKNLRNSTLVGRVNWQQAWMQSYKRILV
jgi:hypothetical protein